MPATQADRPRTRDRPKQGLEQHGTDEQDGKRLWHRNHYTVYRAEGSTGIRLAVDFYSRNSSNLIAAATSASVSVSASPITHIHRSSLFRITMGMPAWS